MLHRHLEAADFAQLFWAIRSQRQRTPLAFFQHERLEEIASCSRCTWQVEEAFFWIDQCRSVGHLYLRVQHPPMDCWRFDRRTTSDRLTSLLDL